MSVPLPDSTSNPRRRVVVVLGMHRSGTSAVAGSLHRLGVDFGPRLMPATPDNPRGYYEHIDVVNLHDRLLLALGGSWDETAPPLAHGWRDDPRTTPYFEEMLAVLRRDFPAAPGPWGLKDPRLCRLLPWWEALWTAMDSVPLFVLVARPAREVVASLARREGFSAAKSYRLWLLHTLEAERDTRGHERVFVDYRRFLVDPPGALQPVAHALGSHWPIEAVGGAGEEGPFVDPALSRTVGDEAGDPVPAWIEDAEAALRLALDAGDEPGMRRTLDGLHRSVAAAGELFPAGAAADADDLRHQLDVSRQQARWYEEEWRKARARADTARAKLDAKRAELDLAKQKLAERKSSTND